MYLIVVIVGIMTIFVIMMMIIGGFVHQARHHPSRSRACTTAAQRNFATIAEVISVA